MRNTLGVKTCPRHRPQSRRLDGLATHVAFYNRFVGLSKHAKSPPRSMIADCYEILLMNRCCEGEASGN